MPRRRPFNRPDKVKTHMQSIARRIIYAPPVNLVIRTTLRPFRTMLPASLKIPVAGSIRVDTEVNGSIVLATNQTCYLTKRLFWDGVKGYEYPSLRVFRDLIRAQRCFLDVGASIGYYSLMAARINPRVQVFAFEPMPSAYAFLVRNIALNGFEENIHAVRMALGDSSGEVEFFASRNPKAAYLKHHLGGASSMAGAEDEYAEAISVTIARLDDFVDQHAVGPVGIMKLDTEATEDRVLLGAEMTVKRDRPFILCEVLPGRIEPELEAFFRANGYVFYLPGTEGLRSVGTIIEHKDSTDFLFVHESRLSEISHLTL